MVTENEEFEFALALKRKRARERSRQNTPTPPAPPQADYTAGDVVGDVGSELVKGAGSTVDFLTGLVGTSKEAASQLTPEQRANMTPQDWADLPQTRAIPAMGDTEGFQDFTKRNVDQYGNKMEGLMTAANFTGSALVPFSPIKKVKQGLDLAKGALLFGGGAGVFDAVTEDTSELGKVGAGLTSVLGTGGVKNLMKSGRLTGGPSKSDEASALIYNVAQDSEKAMTNLRASLARKEAGTLGQLTQDPYILSLEKGAAGNHKFSHKLQTINEKITENAAKALRDVAPQGAKPETMLKYAMAQVDEATGKIAKRTAAKESNIAESIAATENAAIKDIAGVEAGVVNEVVKKENVLAKALAQQETKSAGELKNINLEVLNKVNPSQKPISLVGREGIEEVSDNFTTEYGKVWSKIDSIPINAWLGAKQAAKRADDLLADPADMAIIQNLIKKLDGVANKPTSSKVKDLDNTLRNTASSADSADKPALYGIIKSMRTSLRDGLDDVSAARLKEIDANFGGFLTARKASAKADETRGVFTSEQLNKADKTVSGEARFTKGRGFMQSETDPLLGSIKRNTDTTKALKAAGKESIEATETVGKATANALRTEADAAVGKLSKRAKAVRDAKLRRTKKIKDNTFAGQFARHDDAVNAVDKVFANTTNPAKQTNELVKVASKDKTGNALNGLKSAYITSLSRKMTSGGKITTAAGDKFKSLKNPLSKLFKPDEMARIERAIKESDKIRMHSSIDASTLPQAGEGLKFLMASVLGIKAGTAILSGNSLLMGRVGRDVVVKGAIGTPHKKMLEAMEDMLLNPEKYAKGVEKLRKAPTEKNITQVLTEWGVRSSAVDSDKDKGK